MKPSIIDCQRVESAPTEPVTLAEAKAQLIVTFTDDDTLISSLITQSRKAIENVCKISMVAKTITLIADWPIEWELPWGPIPSGAVTSVFKRSTPTGSGPVSYNDNPGNWETDGVDFLTFRGAGEGCWDWGLPLPRRYTEGYRLPMARYKIIYTAGPYAPDDLKLAILNNVAFYYENKGDDVEIRPTVSAEQGLSSAALRLAEPYTRLQWL